MKVSLKVHIILSLVWVAVAGFMAVFNGADLWRTTASSIAISIGFISGTIAGIKIIKRFFNHCI